MLHHLRSVTGSPSLHSLEYRSYLSSRTMIFPDFLTGYVNDALELTGDRIEREHGHLCSQIIILNNHDRESTISWFSHCQIRANEEERAAWGVWINWNKNCSRASPRRGVRDEKRNTRSVCNTLFITNWVLSYCKSSRQERKGAAVSIVVFRPFLVS